MHVVRGSAVVLLLLAAATCREYTPVAAEVVEKVAPSADDDDVKPAPTVSAQTSVAPAPAPP